MAPKRQEKKGSCQEISEKAGQIALQEEEWPFFKGSCRPRRSPRINDTQADNRSFSPEDEVCQLVLPMVRSSHDYDSDSLHKLLHRMENSYVEAKTFQIQSQTAWKRERAEQPEPLQESRQQEGRYPLGCFFTQAKDYRATFGCQRSQRSKCILRGQEGQGWGHGLGSHECSHERTVEDLLSQFNRSGPQHQNGDRELDQGRERWHERWGETRPLEQGRCSQEEHHQASRKSSECRSRMAQVQIDHEKEISGAKRGVPTTEENPVGSPIQESPGISRCSPRAQEESECRTESDAGRVVERGAHFEATARRRALGDRRFRGRNTRSRGQKIPQPSSGTFSKIQAEKGNLELDQFESDGQIESRAAPGPPLEAAAHRFIDLEMILCRIGAMTPFFQGLCLTLVCLLCFIIDIMQGLFSSSSFWVALASAVWLALCLVSYLTDDCRCKRSMCRVKRRRLVKKVYDRSSFVGSKHGMIFYLLAWSDLGVITRAEKVPVTKDAFEARMENAGTCSWPSSFHHGSKIKGMINHSASWSQQCGSSDIMSLQRPLGNQREEARQAAFERNYLHGDDEMAQEIAALSEHEPNNGICLMTHALKYEHQGTREVRYMLQHGDDFLDIVFAVRQRWSDLIHYSHVAALIYVISQPPPSTTRGVDCLHLIVDGNPELGGMRNLVSLAMNFDGEHFSDFWFQAQRHHDVISRQILVQRLRLEDTCSTEAVTCTCRAGLTVFQENVLYQNQDGLYLTVELDLASALHDGDFMSLMARPFNMNRLVAYVYRLGTEEPFFIQLSGIPETLRIGFINQRMEDRRGEEERGDFFLYSLIAVPSEFQDRDIWPLIQEFRHTMREGYVIVMLDVEVFQHGMTHGERPTDEWREVTYVRKVTNRDIFLQDAEVAPFCQEEASCVVEKNGAEWPTGDIATYELENGGYFKVSIQSQRTDLPFCEQWKQAQQGVQINDMVDTRTQRKRQRDADDVSSYSSDSSTLLQLDSSRGRNFHHEKRDRLPPPGNGVDFDEEVCIIDEGHEHKVIDRSAKNRYIADFCETRNDELMPGLFLDFIRKVRFGGIDDSSDDGFEGQQSQGSATTISLENLLPIQQGDANNIENIIENLREDPDAKFPLRQDWESICGLNPMVQQVLAAQNFCLTGTVTRMHIFLDGSALKAQQGDVKRAAWSFVVGLEHDNVEGPNCKLVGFAGAPLAPAVLSSYHIGENTCDSGEAECAAMFWAGVWLLSWGKQCMIETVVHGDNMPTVRATDATWRCPTTNSCLYEKCRFLWQRIEAEKFPVSLKHLHGHKGHPGNEAADSVAKHFASSNMIFDGTRTKSAKLLALHRDLSRLWWFQEREDMPMHGSNRFFENGNDTIFSAVQEKEPEKLDQCVSVTMSLATINVFAGLDKQASMVSRRKAIAQQADSLRWHVVALQETRFRMSIQKQDELFFMFTAAANKSGCFGCELWFSKKWDIAGRKLRESDLN